MRFEVGEGSSCSQSEFWEMGFDGFTVLSILVHIVTGLIHRWGIVCEA